MSMDDAEMLKGELTSVQRMMDQMTLAKENERDVLQTNLEELLIQHEALKNELITAKDGHTAAQVFFTPFIIIILKHVSLIET